MTDEQQKLENAIVSIIQDGRARCGPGFGKYPLGILAAVEELVPLCDTPRVRDAMQDFKARLER